MTVYYVTSEFRKYAEIYKNTGKDFYFEMQITNDDSNSSASRQSVILKGVNLNSIVLAKLDADSSVLEEDMDFTFEDYSIETFFDDLNGIWDD